MVRIYGMKALMIILVIIIAIIIAIAIIILSLFRKKIKESMLMFHDTEQYF